MRRHRGGAAPAEPKRALSAPRKRPAPRATADPDDGAPRFMLSAGTVAARAAGGAAARRHGPARFRRAGPFAEGDVNVPARLLATSALVYPPAARKAEIELDFPVEIVVDAVGRVGSARAVIRGGIWHRRVCPARDPRLPIRARATGRATRPGPDAVDGAIPASLTAPDFGQAQSGDPHMRTSGNERIAHHRAKTPREAGARLT